MSAEQSSGAFEALLQEERRYPPPPAFQAQAHVSEASVYEQATADLEGFWERQADSLDWFRKWDRVLEWDAPWAKWFVGGQINASYNCLDRHVATWRRNKAAIIWEGEPGDERVLTYQDLYREVNRAALALKQAGVGKGDTVAIYLPMVPELPIVMLACARIGAPHTVIFAGFSPDSIRDRVNDCQAKAIVTADGGYRRGNVIPLKANIDEAVRETPSVQQVVVVKRTGTDVTMQEGRDVWWHEWVDVVEGRECPPEPLDSEHPLYILYTSGTTGKPKGIMHTTGGYLVGTYATAKWVFDLKEDDVYWCTADIGWVTGHSYVVYGPLANGATVLMYEGAPDWPQKDRLWEIIERYGVTIFYTAPTAIRAFMKWGVEWPKRRNMSTLRLLGSVGEPINPEAWIWYHENIGGERCPIVDTWWQTETGMIMISPLPGVTPLKPGSATRPFPGVKAEIRTQSGDAVTVGGGLLALTQPWPAMLRGIYGDQERFVAQYWSKWDRAVYFTGDGAKKDEDGYYWVLGRVDDVINVAGHRIGTMEVESALVDHHKVAEAAVVGRRHELKGQAISAFVILKEGNPPSPQLAAELKEHVVRKIGVIARPEEVLFAADLPKTRSGKIMRRLLKDIAEGKTLGDTTTLADPAVVAKLKEEYEEDAG